MLISSQSIPPSTPLTQVLFEKAKLSIERGEKLAFIGPNGCGKSTLLRFIMGTEEPQHGVVELGEHNVVPNYFVQNQVRWGGWGAHHGAQLFCAEPGARGGWLGGELNVVPNYFVQNQVQWGEGGGGRGVDRSVVRKVGNTARRPTTLCRARWHWRRCQLSPSP